MWSEKATLIDDDDGRLLVNISAGYSLLHNHYHITAWGSSHSDDAKKVSNI